MPKAVVIMLKGVAGVISLVYTNAFNLTRKILFQGFQRKEIVAIDEHITHPKSPLERGYGCVHKTFQGLQSISAAQASAGSPCLSRRVQVWICGWPLFNSNPQIS